MHMGKLCPGQSGTVTAVCGSDRTVKRLRSLGLIPGTQVLCSYRGPGGKVTALAYSGTVIAMRTKDLSILQVEPV